MLTTNPRLPSAKIQFIKFHNIRQCIEEGKVDVDHVRNDEQLADILTKALGRTRFVEMRQKLGVIKVQV